MVRIVNTYTVTQRGIGLPDYSNPAQQGQIVRPITSQSLDTLHVRDRPLDDFYLAGIGWFPEEKVNIDTYVTDRNNLTLPDGVRNLNFTSRSVFSYPTLNLPLILPVVNSLGPVGGVRWSLSHAWNYPAVCFWLSADSYNFGLIRVPPASVVGVDLITLAFLLPADYSTVEHSYTLKANRFNCEFWCDKSLLAIGLFDLPEALPYWNQVPYGLIGTVGFMAGSFGYGGHVNREDGLAGTGPFAFHDLSIYSSDPMPPRQYALYNENTLTKWKAQIIAAGTITSHPVPVWGYPIKTLYFQANGAGSLVIQGYLGGDWRTIKTVAIVADTLDIQAMDIEIPIIRCQFTPTAYPTTVNAAEVYIS